jgi:hypothetical protein
MAIVRCYLRWTGAEHNASNKRRTERILICANGLTWCDAEMINGRRTCGVIRRRFLHTAGGSR